MYYNVTVKVDEKFHVWKAQRIDNKYFRLDNNERINWDIIEGVDFISDN